jgi:3',5'-cyclic AMP phosphodiesterase CpdA
MKRLAAFTLVACAVALALTFAFVLTMAAQASPSAARQPDAPFFFIQLTDPQMGMWADNANVEQETASLEFVVTTINRLRPAFVVVTGDLVNKTGDEAQVNAYLSIVSKVDSAIRVYNVPGNHDVGNAPTAESVAAYVKRFGPDHYTIKRGSFEAIVVNSQLMWAADKMPEAAAAQDAWLQAELERARRDTVSQVVIFEHHPIFLKTPDEADGYENIPRARRAAYLALLSEFGVRHVFAGHLHHNNVARAGDLEMVGTGPIGKPLGEGARSGMRIVKVSAQGIEHRWYDLGELPNRLELPR